MANLSIINSFPKDFIFGTATSSYQIEGVNYGNCGKCHWDSFAKRPNKTHKFQDGGVACAHYLKWDEDLDLVKNCGFSAYRFSFSWPRLLPEGKGRINQEGISFYDKLIDGMLERELKPFGTLYHWDLPINFSEKGGWVNRDTSNYFADYTDLVMKKFGDRLYSIATINEPWCASWLSYYWGEHAPGLKNLSAASKSMHFILLAHGKALEVIRSHNHKNAGIVLNKAYVTTKDDNEQNNMAAELYHSIHNDWFDSAIFNGEYPKNVLDLFKEHIPENYQKDLEIISQPIDWIGINYYTRAIVEHDKKIRDINLVFAKGPLEKTDMGWEIFPEGLSKVIQSMIKKYSLNIPIHITENGMANKDEIAKETINDHERISFYYSHINEIKKLIDKKIPIKSYFAWSLLDNFEWAFGYSKRFGLVHVDFESQIRTPKKSWYEFQSYLVK